MISKMSETEYVIDFVEKPKMIISVFNVRIRSKTQQKSSIGNNTLHSESNENEK